MSPPLVVVWFPLLLMSRLAVTLKPPAPELVFALSATSPPEVRMTVALPAETACPMVTSLVPDTVTS